LLAVLPHGVGRAGADLPARHRLRTVDRR
jgi:hypothetical protein